MAGKKRNKDKSKPCIAVQGRGDGGLTWSGDRSGKSGPILGMPFR